MYDHQPQCKADDTAETDVCVLKNARLPPEGCFFLRDKGNEIFLRINISLPLNNDCLIGRGWPMFWPPRSPDLTSIDFIWNHIKALIYTSPVDSEEDRIACIVEGAATISQQPGIFEHKSVSAVS
jgi:hypothetical protein